MIRRTAITLVIGATAGLLASTATAHATTAPSRCTAQHLALRLGPPKAAAGSTYYRLNFRNEGVTCTLYGYPGVSAVASAAGAEVGPPAVRNPAWPAAPVILRHGGSAYARLQVADTSNYPPAKCRPESAAGLRVFAPGAFDAWFAKVPVSVCTLRPSMSVTPVRIGS